MAGRNGSSTRAAAAQARKPYHAISHTKLFPITVEREGAETTVEFVGHYRDGPSVWVEIEVDAARDEYLEAAYETTETTDPETGETSTASIYRYNRAVEARYRHAVLLAVLQGLQEADADALMGNGQWLEILSELGWFTARTADQEEGDAAGDPEAEAQEPVPTGGGSSPGPPPSTARTTG